MTQQKRDDIAFAQSVFRMEGRGKTALKRVSELLGLTLYEARQVLVELGTISPEELPGVEPEVQKRVKNHRPNREEMAELEARVSEFYHQGLTDAATEKILNCSEGFAYRWRKRNGLPANKHRNGGKT